MEPVVEDVEGYRGQTDPDGAEGEDSVATPTQSRSPSVHGADTGVFDGYPFELDCSDLGDDEYEAGHVSVPERSISAGVEDREGAPANAVDQATEVQSTRHAEILREGGKPVTERM